MKIKEAIHKKKVRVRMLLGILSVLFSISPLSAQLSPQSEVSILTVGPGDELYSIFGHSALLISDPEFSIQNVYNYGTFSFDDDFYKKFTKGQLDYMLSISTFPDEYRGWVQFENRDVTKQVLNLTLAQKNQLYSFLESNAQPENCVYRYDYFYDNCSNRLDKALKQVLGDRIKFFPEDVSKEHNRSGASIRQLTHDYLDPGNKWGELGIETALGIEMDRKITAEQFKFLPDYLMWNYDKAQIRSDSGAYIPLVKEKVRMYTQDVQKKNAEDPWGPSLVFSFIFVLALLVSIPVVHKTFVASLFDFLLLFSCGMVGMLLIFLWFFTVHYSQVNLNIVWANPLSIFLSFFYFSKAFKQKLRKYHLIYGCLLLLTLLLWPFLPQQLNKAYIFICMALCVRCFANYKWAGK